METASPKDNNNPNSSNNNNNSNTGASQHTIVIDSDTDDFDRNDDFYRDYFDQLPCDSINQASILLEYSTMGYTSDLNTGDENCNNNALGKKPAKKAPAKKAPAKKVPPPKPTDDSNDDDPDMFPTVVTLMAYGDKGVSDPIDIDMNNLNDFDVSFKMCSLYLCLEL